MGLESERPEEGFGHKQCSECGNSILDLTGYAECNECGGEWY